MMLKKKSKAMPPSLAHAAPMQEACKLDKNAVKREKKAA